MLIRGFFSALIALVVLVQPTSADETCMSPYMAKIVGQEDYVYIWTLGLEGVGDGEDKLVTVDVNPDSETYAQVIHSISMGGRHEAHHRLRGIQCRTDRGLGPPRHIIRAIGHHRTVIAGDQPRHDRGMRAPGIVGRKVHDGSSMICSSQSSSDNSVSLMVQPRTLTPARCTDSGSPEIR